MFSIACFFSLEAKVKNVMRSLHGSVSSRTRAQGKSDVMGRSVKFKVENGGQVDKSCVLGSKLPLFLYIIGDGQ